eukprot:TRINITY_DN60913_c0_g1_i1.p1 TRINITY_DN60913_c0_g1~~TRINITY_DN60913_c0_g1_i1.p1  ORF type:complete len:253 (-),score=38.18 TRINITY_DN60913_c0_g1_i1:206-964(-)
MPRSRQRRLRALASKKVLRKPARARAAQPRKVQGVPRQPAAALGLAGCLRRGSACAHAVGSRKRRAARSGDDAKRQVRFRDAVEVSEYSRLIGGGGGVPSDLGSALGMGVLIRNVTETLACERPGVGKMDQDVPSVPPRQRALLLREAMGKGAYLKAQREHRQELSLLHSERNASNETEEDFEPMPVSQAQARRVAEKLHREVKAAASLSRKPSAASSSDQAVRRRPAKSAGASRRAATTTACKKHAMKAHR